jgi:long-chain acyl-CoA synthetase
MGGLVDGEDAGSGSGPSQQIRECTMTNLAQRLLTSAAADPAAPAIRLDDETLSYAALADSSARLARHLAGRGLTPGDRVGVMLPNVPEFAVAYYGILLAGGVVVPMNPLLRAREIAHYVGDSGAKILLSSAEVADQAASGTAELGTDLVMIEDVAAAADSPAEIVERSDDDTAVILYTSGTTGKPKGAELTHANLRRNADIFANEWLKLTPDDVLMGCLPLFHTFGQTVGLNCAVFSGACLTLISRFDAGKALWVVERDRVSVFIGVPTMYSALLGVADRERFDTSSLRLCASGGAALPLEVLSTFEKVFGCAIIEGYGLSETAPVASFNPPDGARKAGSVGIPIDGVQMRIVAADWSELPVGEIGEIAIRGHNIMKGYWQQPQATAEVMSAEGWFRTGDLGRMDEDGYFYIVDRKKALIIRGGYNVYPREVEEVLYEHPAVVEAAVVGVPHETLGEEVAAAVVLAPGASAEPGEIREYVKERVASYKYPRRVWVVDELPKGPTGKILRRDVKPPQPTE